MEKKQLIILVFILVLAASLRIGFAFFNPYNMDVDSDEPWSKINLALRWNGSSTLMPDLNFGPLHTYMISSFIFLSPSHFVGFSRLISLIFGILMVWLYYSVVSRLFDRPTGLLSAFLLAVYPLHIHLSSVSLAETTAYFLLAAALYFLVSYLEKPQWSSLAFSCICLNLCGMLRFESWIFVLLFAALILRKEFTLRRAGAFLVLASVFPAIWVFLNYKYTGNPLGFIETSARVTAVSMQDADLWRRSFGFLKMCSYGLNPVIFALGVFGFGLALAGLIRRTVFLFLLVSVFFIFELRSLSGSYAYYILRYSLILGLLLIPFAAAGLLYLRGKYRSPRSALVGFLIAVALLSSAATLRGFSRELNVPDSTRQLIGWIKNNHSGNKKVLLECGVDHPFIAINSGLNADAEENYDHLGMLAIQQDLTFSGKVRRFTFLILLVAVFGIYGLKRRFPAALYYTLMPFFISWLFAISLGLGREIKFRQSDNSTAMASLIRSMNESDYIVMNRKKGYFRLWLPQSGQELGTAVFENDDWKVYAKKY